MMIAKKSGERGLNHCPTCGSSRIRMVCNDYRALVRGEEVVVPNLEREECPDCGEVLFSPEAMRRIENYRKQVASTR